MKLGHLLRACSLGLAAALAFPAQAFAQSHPEFVPLGRVSAAMYRPDSGPAPHIAFLVAHRTANNLNNIACTELSKRGFMVRSEEHTSELQSHLNLVCRLLLEKKNKPI